MTPGLSRGFTLIELSVALAAVGLLLALLYEAFAGGLQAWARSGAVMEEHAVSAAARGVLRQLAGEALCCADAGDGARVFAGNATSLSFTTRLPSHFMASGPAEVVLAVEEGDGGTRLRLRWGGGARENRILFEGLAAASLAYDCHGVTIEALVCRSDWVGQDRLPDNLLIRASYPDGDPRAWIPLLLAVGEESR